MSKLEQFDGTNYKRWSQKILMYFEQLDINFVLFKDALVPVDVAVDVETTPPNAALQKKNQEYVEKFERAN